MKKRNLEDIYKLNIHQFDGEGTEAGGSDAGSDATGTDATGSNDSPVDYINRTTDTTATTGNDLSPEMRVYYDRTLLENAKPKLVHDQFGQQRPIPKNAGQSINFRKFDKAKVVITPLDEGITPNGMKLNMTQITTPVYQYGAYYELSDWLQLTAPDPIMTEVAQNLGDQAGETLDTITREVLQAGTNVLFGDGTVNARTSITSSMKPTLKGFKKCKNILSRADAATFQDGRYVAIIHPDTWLDLSDSVEDIYKYVESAIKSIYDGEIGVYAGMRFIEASRAKIFAEGGASNQDVYGSLVLGRNAYGITKIGGAIETIVHQLGSSGVNDALNQRSSMGWKANKAVTILDQSAIVRYEHATSTNLHVDDLEDAI